MTWLLAGIVAVGLAIPGVAQTLSPLAPPDRSSPRDWVASFLTEADRFTALYSAYKADRTGANNSAIAEQLDVLRSFLDLGSFPPAFQNKIGGEAAIELIDILNRLPQDAILSGPADPVGREARPDVWMIPGTEIVLARKNDGLNAGSYVVPHETIIQLPDFHARMIDAPLVRHTPYPSLRAEQLQATGPLIPQFMVDALPEPLTRSILGTPVWKQIVAACLFFLVLWLNIWWSGIARRAIHSLPEAMAGLFRLSGPFVLSISFALFYLFIETQLNEQGVLALATLLVRNLSLIAAGAWAVWTLTMIVTEMLIGSERVPEEVLDAHLTRLIGKIVGIAGATAAVIYGLSTLGIPAAGLITSLGVGGVGIALAARVTIENLFGGLVLLIDRPFRVGDWIEIGAGSGRVEDIGGRSCRIVTAEGTRIVIPNSLLSAEPITNLGRGPNQRLQHVLPLPKGMSRDDVETRLASVRAVLAAHPKLDSQRDDSAAVLTGGPDGTLQISIDVPVNADLASDFDAIRTETLLALLHAASAAGGNEENSGGPAR
jgi:MscS family membrane protein